MNIGRYYTILQITEPDYGCEETHRAEPTALLKLLEEPSGDVRYVEVPERVLAEQGLREGKKVTFATDGTVRKYVRVVAAIIRDPKGYPGRIFATARGYGEYKSFRKIFCNSVVAKVCCADSIFSGAIKINCGFMQSQIA